MSEFRFVTDDKDRIAVLMAAAQKFSHSVERRRFANSLAVDDTLQSHPFALAIRQQSNLVANGLLCADEVLRQKPVFPGRFEKCLLITYDRIIEVDPDPAFRLRMIHGMTSLDLMCRVSARVAYLWRGTCDGQKIIRRGQQTCLNVILAPLRT